MLHCHTPTHLHCPSPFQLILAPVPLRVSLFVSVNVTSRCSRKELLKPKEEKNNLHENELGKLIGMGRASPKERPPVLISHLPRL